MKPTTTIAAIVVAGVVVVASLFFETWLLGLILSWFGVSLTFWQNFAIIALANMIFNNFGISSK